MKRKSILKHEDVQASIFMGVFFGLILGLGVPIVYLIEGQEMDLLRIGGCLAFGPAMAIVTALIFVDIMAAMITGAAATVSVGLGLTILADPVVGSACAVLTLVTIPPVTILSRAIVRPVLIKVATGCRHARSWLRITWLLHRPQFLRRWSRRRLERRWARHR
jgi:hypothetical protein